LEKLQRPLVGIDRETCSPLTTPGEQNWFKTWMFLFLVVRPYAENEEWLPVGVFIGKTSETSCWDRQGDLLSIDHSR
jgi:hypothetical protein